MTDLRTAAQQALEAMEYSGMDVGKFNRINAACAALRAALAQQAEPVVGVVWSVDWGRDGDRACASIVKKRADGSAEIVAVEYAPYTTPPQRKPLMEGALMGVYIDFDRAADPAWSKAEYLLHFARAVERAHGITDPQIEDRLARHGINPCPDCHGIGYDASGQLCWCQQNPSF